MKNSVYYAVFLFLFALLCFDKLFICASDLFGSLYATHFSVGIEHKGANAITARITPITTRHNMYDLIT